MVTLTKKNFNLFPIDEQNYNNWMMCDYMELSDFHCAALKWIGDVLRQKNSQFFWNNGAYCLYTDKNQNHEQCVWMSAGGSAMFEDITEKRLYRIEFVNQ